MRSGSRSDRGQSSVELALVLPFVALVALLIVQVVVIAHHQLLVTHAAREAVRAAAVSDDDPAAAATRAAHQAGALDVAHLDVTTVLVGSRVEVTVTYDDPTDVVLAGTLVPDVQLRADAVMRRESA